jgi:hypothetical protein
MTTPERQPLNRRRTDRAANDALYVLHRTIVEHSYRLFVEGGRDHRCVEEYWRVAERTWMDHSE